MHKRHSDSDSTTIRIFQRASVAAMLVLVAVSCAGEKEMLQPKSGSVPAGIDLSGRWQMQDDIDDMQRRIQRAIRQTDGVDERKIMRRVADQQRRGGRPNSRDVGGLVHVFLESAAYLKVTQTKDGLFIGFDRSVVEEYRFGEVRRVSIGGAVAQRASGWEGEQYVIETLGEEGMKLTERYELANSNRSLTREIVLRSKELEQVTIVQTFSIDES